MKEQSLQFAVGSETFCFQLGYISLERVARLLLVSPPINQSTTVNYTMSYMESAFFTDSIKTFGMRNRGCKNRLTFGFAWLGFSTLIMLSFEQIRLGWYAYFYNWSRLFFSKYSESFFITSPKISIRGIILLSIVDTLYLIHTLYSLVTEESPFCGT